MKWFFIIRVCFGMLCVNVTDEEGFSSERTCERYATQLMELYLLSGYEIVRWGCFPTRVPDLERQWRPGVKLAPDELI